jgi:hypothetical protein
MRNEKDLIESKFHEARNWFSPVHFHKAQLKCLTQNKQAINC